MNYDIFENEKEKQEAIKDLKRLKDDPAWKIILKALESNTTFLEDQIKKLSKQRGFENLEQVYLIEDKIDYLSDMKSLPDTLIKAAQPAPEEPPEEDTDIYDTPGDDQPNP